MKPPITAAIFALPMAVSSPAEAAPGYELSIPAGSLNQSISRLSSQTGVSIGSINIDLSRHKAPALKGRYTLRRALRRLLKDTRLDFVIVNDRAVTIVESRSRKAPVPPRKQPVGRPNQSSVPDNQTIIVTASKQGSALRDFSGTAAVVDVGNISPIAESDGLEGLLSLLPTTAQTNLGSGRNKLFLRGVADSSLIGTTQSTVGLYLDETRLSYSGPNPDLRSYDQSRVEILEGPQGTLFGAGTIGGIVKIVTHKPDSEQMAGKLWANIGATQGGDFSYDLASMINLPLSDNLALRAVGYYQRDGGYIDDVGRGLSDVNRAEIIGGRLGLRYKPGNDWIVDASLLHQSNQTQDGQYAERDRDDRTRISLVAQPFEADITSGSVTVSRKWDAFQLVSTLGYTKHKNFSTFDASILSQDSTPMIFNEEIASNLITHETRLRWNNDDGHSAVLGISYLDNRDIVTLEMGAVDQPEELSETENGNLEAALFGEASYQVSADWSASIGGRLTYSRSIAEIIIDGGQELDPSRKTVRFLPKASLAWEPDFNGLIYASYQQGFRSGGISVGLGNDNPITQFASDTIQTFEAGVKVGRVPDSRFKASIALFYSSWNDIQADLIDEAGFPRTTNIGDGLVYGVSLSANWALTEPFSIYARFFANESELVEEADDFVIGDESRLPNIAEMGANIGWSWKLALPEDKELTIRSDMRYVGASQLGIDPFLSLEQGDYLTVNGSVQLQSDRWRFSLNLENILNSAANTFALGNPFTVADGLQTTPLRPRSVTLGARLAF